MSNKNFNRKIAMALICATTCGTIGHYTGIMVRNVNQQRTQVRQVRTNSGYRKTNDIMIE